MIDLDLILDLAAGVCLVLASLLSLGAAVGLLRFPDSLSRLHAGTKPQILGLILDPSRGRTDLFRQRVGRSLPGPQIRAQIDAFFSTG